MKKNYFLVIIMLIVSVLGIVGSVPKKVFASEKATITWQLDANRLNQNLPQELVVQSKKLVDFKEEYNVGDKIKEPKISTAFLGYYDYVWEVNNIQVDLQDYVVTKSETIKIKWIPIDYTIRYFYLTQQEQLEIENIKYEETYNIENPVRYYRPERPYYYFVDWYESADFNEGEILIYTDKSCRSDKVLYAKWNPIVYRINYHTDAVNKENPKIYTVESPTYILQTPQKIGHIFLGWYYDKAFTQRATQIKKGEHGNLDLYPMWKLETYVVTYILPDGTKEQVVCEYGKSAKTPNLKSDMFNILTYSKSRNNITDNTEITVKYVNIWWVYVLILVIICAVITAIILVSRKRKSKMLKLRQIYQSNLVPKKRKIR